MNLRHYGKLTSIVYFGRNNDGPHYPDLPVVANVDTNANYPTTRIWIGEELGLEERGSDRVTTGVSALTLAQAKELRAMLDAAITDVELLEREMTFGASRG